MESSTKKPRYAWDWHPKTDTLAERAHWNLSSADILIAYQTLRFVYDPQNAPLAPLFMEAWNLELTEITGSLGWILTFPPNVSCFENSCLEGETLSYKYCYFLSRTYRRYVQMENERLAIARLEWKEKVEARKKLHAFHTTQAFANKRLMKYHEADQNYRNLCDDIWSAVEEVKGTTIVEIEEITQPIADALRFTLFRADCIINAAKPETKHTSKKHDIMKFSKVEFQPAIQIPQQTNTPEKINVTT